MEDHLGWFKLVGLSHYQHLINITLYIYNGDISCWIISDDLLVIIRINILSTSTDQPNIWLVFLYGWAGLGTFFTSRNAGKKNRFSLGFTQGVDGAVVLEGMSCIMLSNPHHSWKNYGYPHFFGYDHGYHGYYCWYYCWYQHLGFSVLLGISILMPSMILRAGRFETPIHTPKAPATLGFGWHPAEWGGNPWWEVALSQWGANKKSSKIVVV